MTNEEWLNEPMNPMKGLDAIESQALAESHSNEVFIVPREVIAFVGAHDRMELELLGVGTGTNTVRVHCGYCGWTATFPAKQYKVAAEEYDNHVCDGEGY